MIKKPSRIGAPYVKVGDILVHNCTEKFVVRKVVWDEHSYSYWYYDIRGRVLAIPASARVICWKTQTWYQD